MVAKSTILAELGKRGQFSVLDYPINLSASDDSYTDGLGIFIGQFREHTFDDIYPIIMHEYMHCRLQHFSRVEKAKTPLMQFLYNLSMDIEINEYLLTKGITSKYFQETGQFKNKNTLSIEIPSNLHTFEEILAYIMKKLPKQKVEALQQLSKQDFQALGADLMGNPNDPDMPNIGKNEVQEQELSEQEKEAIFEKCEVSNRAEYPEMTDGIAHSSLAEVCASLSRFGIQREVKLTQEHMPSYKLSWTRLLNKFVGKLKGRVLARTYQRPRRSGDPSSRTVLPAFKNMSGTVANLDIYIDISGSMYNRNIKRFVESQRSLRQLSTETRITYYAFNQKVFPVKYSELPKMQIGGGTDFTSMLNQILERNNPTVIFTDMCTSEGDLSRLKELQDKLMVITVNPDYKNTDLPYVVYVEN